MDKRKPDTGSGCLGIIINQDQTFHLILALVNQGYTDPEEVARIIKII